MKKFLLALGVAAMTATAFATPKTVTYDFKTNDYGLTRESDNNSGYIENGTTLEALDGTTITLTKTTGNGWRLWSDGLRAYKSSNGMTIKTTEGKITNVEISAKSKVITAYSVDGGAPQDVTNTDLVEVECNAAEVDLAFTISNNGAIYSVTLTIAEEGEVIEEKPEAPVISGVYNDEAFSYTVTMSCATEGATIYYTEDGEVPTAASTAYTAPLTEIYGGTTIKAVAIKGDVASKVVTYTAPFVASQFVELSDIVEYVKESKQDIPVVLKGATYTAVYQKGDYLYLYDGQAYMMIYQYKETVEAGQQFTEIEGALTVYNNLPEIKNCKLVSADKKGDVPAPAILDSFSYLNSMLNYYVEVDNIAITTEGGNYYITDEDKVKIVLYNRFNVDLKEAENATVIGFVSIYKDTLQIFPTSIDYTTGIAGIEATQGKADYFNLQGARVNEPSNGVYIRVINGKASKVIVK